MKSKLTGDDLKVTELKDVVVVVMMHVEDMSRIEFSMLTHLGSRRVLQDSTLSLAFHAHICKTWCSHWDLRSDRHWDR